MRFFGGHMLFFAGLYVGGFIYVLGVAAADDDCPTLLDALLSAAIWPWGLYQVIRYLNGEAD